MISSYNRLSLKDSQNSDEQIVFYGGRTKTGLEWNQYIGRIIINDFIKQLDEYDGTDFAPYMNVLPYIEYGLFQSAINIINTINIEGLSSVKAWLLKALAEGEDRYE